MAWLRVDQQHQEILDLLVSSSRVASVAGRTRTGPYPEQRQVVVLAAAIGFAARKRASIDKAGVQIRDSILMDASAAQEVAFALAYHDEQWDLGVVADGDAASDRRVKVLEEYAAGGFQILKEKYAEMGGAASATELLEAVRKQVRPPELAYKRGEDGDEGEDPLIAILRRTGKFREA